MLNLTYSSQFKKDCKKHKWINNGKFEPKLDKVLRLLASCSDLPPELKDHKLNNSKRYKDCRELHIEPDRLLIYQINGNELTLRCIRTGSHSELFESRRIERY